MYKPTIWQDKVEGVQEGTDMNAANFNNIEIGVMENDALAAMDAAYRRYEADAAAQEEIVAISETLTTSGTAVAIAIPSGSTRNRTTYNVAAEINAVSGGTVGDLIIDTKQANGFKAKYTGTATSVAIRFKVSGGMI